MRILVTSIPGMGHIHPLVPLVSGLQRAGHEVVWATGPEACDRVERYGFRTVPAGPTAAERGSLAATPPPSPKSVPPRERRQTFFGARFGAAAIRMHRDLAPIVDDLHPDLIVHDAAEFAAAPIAKARGIPHVTVAFSGTLSDALVASIVEGAADE